MDGEQEHDAEDMEKYLREIQQVPPLSKEQERQLIQQMEQGKAAQEQLIETNRRLVVSIAQQYTRHGLKLPDLIRAGHGGLLRAVEHFDATKTYTFSTYATWWIRRAITQVIASSR
jgi:RNA polymerase primary sigma factor